MLLEFINLFSKYIQLLWILCTYIIYDNSQEDSSACTFSGLPCCTASRSRLFPVGRSQFPAAVCPARFLRGHASARNKYATVLGFQSTKPKDRRIYNGPYRNPCRTDSGGKLAAPHREKPGAGSRAAGQAGECAG